MYCSIYNQINSKTEREITIVAVSKKQSVNSIKTAFKQGARHFGENYLQEAKEKILVLGTEDIQWHFIGSIQSNKTRAIAEQFGWVQTVDKLKIAQRLNIQRLASMGQLNVCIQVNIDRESQKGGCMPEQLLPLARAILELPQLKLRGIMVMPRRQPDEQLRKTFRQGYLLYQQLCLLSNSVDTLSMGMSADFNIAVEEGSTMVRIGTAIFGSRQ